MKQEKREEGTEGKEGHGRKYGMGGRKKERKVNEGREELRRN